MVDSLRQALDPVIFARAALGFVADRWQESALRSVSKRVLFNCSRQSGKSTVAAILAFHQAIFRPDQMILLLSPSLRQSSELFRKVLAMEALIPNAPAKAEETKLFLTLTNGSRIVSLPGKEGTIRGYSGVDLIIVDEAAQVADDLYRSIRPMLAVSGGSLLLLSTPRGKRGFFFGEWVDGGVEWERVEVKATDCPRISKAFLAEEEKTLGGHWYRQEYLCSFEEMEDSVFAYDVVQAAFTADVKPLFGSPLSDSIKPLFDGRQ